MTTSATTTTTTGLDQLTGTYDIDPAHSALEFAAKHAMVTTVRGRFSDFEGVLRLDGTNPENSSAEVRIRVGSLDSRSDQRDEHLRSADFFDVEKFPKITFVSSKVKPLGGKKAQVEGTLTIKGVSKPVTLDIEVFGTGPDAWGNTRGGFEGRTKVNRQDFGVAWNKAVEGGGTILGDEVEITLNVEAVRQKPAEAPTKK